MKLIITEDKTIQVSPSDELGIRLGHALIMHPENDQKDEFGYVHQLKLVCEGNKAMTIGIAKLSVPGNMEKAFEEISFLELQ